jgi:hypothetical protein
MGISPWYVGQVLPLWQITLTPDTGTSDVTGLYSSAFTMRFINTLTSAEIVGEGTFSIIQANPAIVQYQLATSDVTTPGTYTVLVEVDYPGIDVFSLGTWQLLPR